jgi:endonuclease III
MGGILEGDKVKLESLESKKKRAKRIVAGLRKAIPDATIELHYHNPMQLLVATILSAQCTDKRVNMVTPSLFKKYKTAKDFATAKVKTLQNEIRSTGFYRAKTKNIIGAAKDIVKRYGGKVPSTMEELTTLAGVGRKTANVVLGNLFDTPGLVVDTHVKRISNLLDLTQQSDPVKIEFELQEIIPKRNWVEFSHLLIKHGRRTCIARRPRCGQCEISESCPSGQDLGSVSVGLPRSDKRLV